MNINIDTFPVTSALNLHLYMKRSTGVNKVLFRKYQEWRTVFNIRLLFITGDPLHNLTEIHTT